MICAYDNPEGFADYIAMQQHEHGATPEKKLEEGSEDEDEEDDEPHGYALVSCDQSAITGESLAVDKHKGDTCYASSAVKRGEAFMVVSATGDRTFVGRAAALVNKASGGTGHFTEVKF